METASQTRAEAAQGDAQAVTKLAQLAKMSGVRPTAEVAPAAAASTATSTTPTTTDQSTVPSAPPPPTGAVLNVKQ